MSNNSEQYTTTHPIRCFQLNIYKSREAVHSMLNEKLDDTDIIFLQEPGWGYIGTDPGSGEKLRDQSDTRHYGKRDWSAQFPNSACHAASAFATRPQTPIAIKILLTEITMYSVNIGRVGAVSSFK